MRSGGRWFRSSPRRGYDVIGTTRELGNADLICRLGARAVVADAIDRDSLFAVFRAERPEAVIHQLTDLGRRVS